MKINKPRVKKIAETFLVCFLPAFMLFIFGPGEIFFANYIEFQFVYKDFVLGLSAIAVAASIVLTVIAILLPDRAYRIMMSLIFALSVMGYVQVMFLNQKLDLLGMRPEASKVPLGRGIFNTALWVLFIAAVIVFSFYKKELWKKTLVGLSAFLIAIQAVALAALFYRAPNEAVTRKMVKEADSEEKNYESVWHLSPLDQYTVSAGKNVIVIILDNFSNDFIDRMEVYYPGATDFLHDFTYYNNAEAVYFGTYPSLPHMLTGCELEMDLPVNEWLRKIWSNEKTVEFYTAMKQNNWRVNLYTTDLTILCGTNDYQMLDGMFSNLEYSPENFEISYKRLFQVMSKMSTYRMAPDLLKSNFYSTHDEYVDIVNDEIYYRNYDFYEGLTKNGLRTDSDADYLIFRHLSGTHEFTTADDGSRYPTRYILEETAKGCMTITEEYLNELKRLGVYDNAVIIITSDHGNGATSCQVPFYIKQAGEHHDQSPVTDAPISHHEFFATIAQAVGEDGARYGSTIYDYKQGEMRERTYWGRELDGSRPRVPCYTGTRGGASNVYVGYTYTGNRDDLKYAITNKDPIYVYMIDSYF